MLVFAREALGDVLPELRPLWHAHWAETEQYRAGRRLNPDEERYKSFSASGYYQLFTARDSENGRLVGNAGMYLTVSMHEQTKIATEDTWFLLPRYRKGRNAINLLKFVEEQMKAQGVQVIYMSTKFANKAGRILEIRGYSPMATQYWKEI